MKRKQIRNPLPKELYDILACPKDKAKLNYTKDKKGLKCVKCGNVYPIRNGIPIFV